MSTVSVPLASPRNRTFPDSSVTSTRSAFPNWDTVSATAFPPTRVPRSLGSLIARLLPFPALNLDAISRDPGHCPCGFGFPKLPLPQPQEGDGGDHEDEKER